VFYFSLFLFHFNRRIIYYFCFSFYYTKILLYYFNQSIIIHAFIICAFVCFVPLIMCLFHTDGVYIYTMSYRPVHARTVCSLLICIVFGSLFLFASFWCLHLFSLFRLLYYYNCSYLTERKWKGWSDYAPH